MPTSRATAADRRDAVDSISTVGGLVRRRNASPLRESEGGEGQWGAKQPLIVPRPRPLWIFARGVGEVRRAAAEYLTC